MEEGGAERRATLGDGGAGKARDTPVECAEWVGVAAEREEKSKPARSAKNTSSLWRVRGWRSLLSPTSGMSVVRRRCVQALSC